jgi:hypothetical protein
VGGLFVVLKVVSLCVFVIVGGLVLVLLGLVVVVGEQLVVLGELEGKGASGGENLKVRILFECFCQHVIGSREKSYN